LSFNYVNNICKLVIKYSEFIIIFKSENNLLFITDIEALKYGYQIGLDTLVVHTINYEY
jgi:hypothetical protein